MSKPVWQRMRRAGFLVATVCIACGRSEVDTLTVFGAASLRDSLTEVAEMYAAQYGRPPVRFNFAGSNTLAMQLLSSPRADLFMSANSLWMDRLDQANRLLPGSRRNLLTNKLVLVANTHDAETLDDICSLEHLNFEHFVIGNPDAVPAGTYAKQILESVHCPDFGALWPTLLPRVLPMPDVRSALAQIAMRRGTVGIVYRTDARSSDGVRMLKELELPEGQEVVYPAALLRRTLNPVRARDFFDFLQGTTAATVWRRHGFGLIKDGS